MIINDRPRCWSNRCIQRSSLTTNKDDAVLGGSHRERS